MSVSSKHSKKTNPGVRNTPKKHLQVERICACKTKTEENRIKAELGPSSDQTEFSKELSETNSVGNVNSVKEGNHNDSLQKAMKEGHNMINSLGPQAKEFSKSNRMKKE